MSSYVRLTESPGFRVWVSAVGPCQVKQSKNLSTTGKTHHIVRSCKSGSWLDITTIIILLATSISTFTTTIIVAVVVIIIILLGFSLYYSRSREAFQLFP